MEPFSCGAASLGPSEGRKRSQPNDFRDTGHEVRRPCLDPSTESFIDELLTVSDVALPKWMQNGMGRASHVLENNLPDIQNNMKNAAINWSALPDPTVSSYPPNPEFNNGVTNGFIQPEVGLWSFNGRAGDFNTTTNSPPWNSEYEYTPFEAQHRAFDNNYPDTGTVEVAYNAGTDGVWSDQLIFDDAILPAFQQPAPNSQNIPDLGASINENSPIPPFQAHLMSETSGEAPSNLSSASSPAAPAVVQYCSESAGMLGSNSCPDLGYTTLSESLEHGKASLQAKPDRSTAECDLCLGVVSIFIYFLDMLVDTIEITTTLVSSIGNAQGVDVVPVDVDIFGKFIKLTFQSTKKYAGMLNYPVLCALLKDFNVRLSATLTSSESRLSEKSDNQKAKSDKKLTVRIVVYGIEREKSVIANLLSDADLFLQHPTDAECGRHRKYVNPQYLLRPGTNMPRLENLSLMADARSLIQSEKLDEVDLARLSRIFDCAELGLSDPMVTTEPSPRLQSTLMR